MRDSPVKQIIVSCLHSFCKTGNKLYTYVSLEFSSILHINVKFPWSVLGVFVLFCFVFYISKRATIMLREVSLPPQNMLFGDTVYFKLVVFKQTNKKGSEEPLAFPLID